MRVGPSSAASDFEIVTLWQLDAEPEELTAIVLEPELLAIWCTSIFMYGDVAERGRPDGLGLALRLHTKGLLPHSFFFVARIVDLVPHRFMRIAVSGDFEGAGELTVEPDPEGRCAVRLHWRTRVLHPWLRPVVPWLRPVFVWNHKWAMRQAHRLIQAEIDRRRNNAAVVPANPAFPHNLSRYGVAQRRRHAHRGWIE